MSFTLLTYQSRPELPLIAQILESNAKELGISIKIQQVENIDEYLAKNDDWDLATYRLNDRAKRRCQLFAEHRLYAERRFKLQRHRKSNLDQMD